MYCLPYLRSTSHPGVEEVLALANQLALCPPAICRLPCVPPEGFIDVLVEGSLFTAAPARRGLVGAGSLLSILGGVEVIGWVYGSGRGGRGTPRVGRVRPRGA